MGSGGTVISDILTGRTQSEIAERNPRPLKVNLEDLEQKTFSLESKSTRAQFDSLVRDSVVRVGQFDHGHFIINSQRSPSHSQSQSRSHACVESITESHCSIFMPRSPNIRMLVQLMLFLLI